MNKGMGSPIIGNGWILLALLGLALLTYLPLFNLPYLLLDDNWIIRSVDPPEQHPGLKQFVALTQGRPVFAVMLKATRLAAHLLGMETLRYVRLLAIVIMGGFAFLLFLWLRRFGMATPFAAPCAALAITLPAFQIYVAGGPWLTVPLVMTAGAMHLLYQAAYRYRLGRPAGYVRVVIAWLFLLASLGTYQTTALVSLSFFLFALLTMNLARPSSDDLRFLLVTASVICASVLIYYLTWKVTYAVVLPNNNENRYNPGALLKMEGDGLSNRLKMYWTMRIPQNLNLWVVSWKRSFFFHFTLGVALAGLAANGILGARRGLPPIRIVLDGILKTTAGCILLFLSDCFAFVSGHQIISFTTTLAFSLSVILVVFWALRTIVLCLPDEARTSPRLRRVSWAVSACVALVAAGAAQASVTSRLAVPLWLESKLARDTIRAYSHAHGQIQCILVHTRPRNFGDSGEQEFAWSNYGLSFYCYWITRNHLQSLGLDGTKVRIDVLDSNTGQMICDPYFPGPRPAGVDVLEIDFSRLRLR